jgi:xanthine/CO dehydrogenase XdhC/CoxF family maturation factor
MSHNYSLDLGLLKFLLASPARYIGVMGPRKRTERMLCELAAGDGLFSLREADRARLHSPAGLDIGATTPAEIAIAVLAEVIATGSAPPYSGTEADQRSDQHSGGRP